MQQRREETVVVVTHAEGVSSWSPPGVSVAAAAATAASTERRLKEDPARANGTRITNDHATRSELNGFTPVASQVMFKFVQKIYF